MTLIQPKRTREMVLVSEFLTGGFYSIIYSTTNTDGSSFACPKCSVEFYLAKKVMNGEVLQFAHCGCSKAFL